MNEFLTLGEIRKKHKTVKTTNNKSVFGFNNKGKLERTYVLIMDELYLDKDSELFTFVKEQKSSTYYNLF
jgi:hypothetical protein